VVGSHTIRIREGTEQFTAPVLPIRQLTVSHGKHHRPQTSKRLLALLFWCSASPLGSPPKIATDTLACTPFVENHSRSFSFPQSWPYIHAFLPLLLRRRWDAARVDRPRWLLFPVTEGSQIGLWQCKTVVIAAACSIRAPLRLRSLELNLHVELNTVRAGKTSIQAPNPLVLTQNDTNSTTAQDHGTINHDGSFTSS
jgi:hypothetical protein